MAPFNIYYGKQGQPMGSPGPSGVPEPTVIQNQRERLVELAGKCAGTLVSLSKMAATRGVQALQESTPVVLNCTAKDSPFVGGMMGAMNAAIAGFQCRLFGIDPNNPTARTTLGLEQEFALRELDPHGVARGL